MGPIEAKRERNSQMKLPFYGPAKVVVVIPAASSQPLFLGNPDERGNGDHIDDTREWL